MTKRSDELDDIAHVGSVSQGIDVHGLDGFVQASSQGVQHRCELRAGGREDGNALIVRCAAGQRDDGFNSGVDLVVARSTGHGNDLNAGCAAVCPARCAGRIGDGADGAV